MMGFQSAGKVAQPGPVHRKLGTRGWWAVACSTLGARAPQSMLRAGVEGRAWDSFGSWAHSEEVKDQILEEQARCLGLESI